jgi:predicted kinase
MTPSLYRVAARHWTKHAGPLQDVSKLRYQAVFLMGAGGSGKSYVSQRWLKYAPGGGSSGYRTSEGWDNRLKQEATEQERSLSNLKFDDILAHLTERGIRVELVGSTHAKIPFRLYTYDTQGHEVFVPPERWATDLPNAVYQQVQGLTEVVFSTPVHELPSYWRQVNGDVYKEELAGYLETQPGYVHEMSSDMAKAYFEAAVTTGDPLVMDGTGLNLRKMLYQIQRAKQMGYHTTLVFVFVPLTVNHIRNATRSRNISPHVVTAGWRDITSNYKSLAAVADKSLVVNNRNDSFDIKRFRERRQDIDAFIRGNTKYDTLYDLIAEQAPQELQEWGEILKPSDDMTTLVTEGWTPLTTQQQAQWRAKIGTRPDMIKTFGRIPVLVAFESSKIQVFLLVKDTVVPLVVHTTRGLDGLVLRELVKIKTSRA